jgi:hypothetical protein
VVAVNCEAFVGNYDTVPRRYLHVINDPADSTIDPAAQIEAAQACVVAQTEAAQGDTVSLGGEPGGKSQWVQPATAEGIPLN